MRDELDPRELRDLYARLRPPPLADDFAEADPETARVVRWMQGAWHGVVPPRALASPGARRRRSMPYVPRARVAAAAAVLLLVAGAVLWRLLSPIGKGAAPKRVAQAPAVEPARGIEVLDVRPDRVELRAGPVRLLLLDPPPEPSEPPRS